MSDRVRWQYRVIPWHSDSTWSGKGGMDALAGMLTDLGVGAWELVLGVQVATDTQYLVFKRPAENGYHESAR